MDSIIWSLHAHLQRAAAEYALIHPENAAAANALPYLAVIVIYAWLAVTLWLGLRTQYWYFQGISPVRRYLADLQNEVDSASVIDGAGTKNQPRLDADGHWYRPEFDKETGEVVGKKRCDPPAHTQPIGVVTGGQRFTLRRS